MEKRIDKITAGDIRKEFGKLRGMSQEEKDAALAFLLVALDRLTDVVKTLAEDKNNKAKVSEVKEIEDILSLGPKWMHFSRKVKRNKK